MAEVARNERTIGLKAVTSDCKPWSAPLRLSVDDDGLAGQERTGEWFSNIERIYEEYAIYSQADGSEQAVFANVGEAGQSRSSRLVGELDETLELKESGVALDIGCGNGSFLRAFGAQFPAWELHGTEYDDKNEKTVLSIPGVSRLITNPIETLKGSYDFISLVHVLEHIPEPGAFLECVRRLLSPEGVLFIEVPYYMDNPFELLIYDHASHFSLKTLERTLVKSRFDIELISNSWVSKEISLLAKVADDSVVRDSLAMVHEAEALRASLDWLCSFRERMLTYAHSRDEELYIFGSSIGATWAYSELEGEVDGFLDQDRARIGKRHLGEPIVSPEDCPVGAAVLVPLPHPIAVVIKEKFMPDSLNWLIPEAMPECMNRYE